MRTPKTNGDLVIALMNQLGGDPVGALFRYVLPCLGRSAKLNEPLTDEQFCDGLANIARELPTIRQWIASPRARAELLND